MECIGDGRVNYRPEKVLEALYAARLEKWLVLTFDYQFFVDPAHSADADRFRSSQRAFMRSSEGLTRCPVGVKLGGKGTSATRLVVPNEQTLAGVGRRSFSPNMYGPAARCKREFQDRRT